MSLFIKGDPNKGKSVYINTMQRLHGKGEFATITALSRKGLGVLEHVSGKSLLTIPDMPQDFFKIIPESTFTSIVDGAEVDIGKLYGTSMQAEVEFHLLSAGNEIPSFDDLKGRISRRWVIVDWDYPIAKKDTQLESRIIAELPIIVAKMVAFYHVKRDRVGADQPCKLIPEAMLVNKREVQVSANSLVAFVDAGDDIWGLCPRDGCVAQLKDIRKAYIDHLERYDMPMVEPSYRALTEALETLNYEVKKARICSSCNTRHTDGRHCGSQKDKSVLCAFGCVLYQMADDGDINIME